MSTNNQWSCFHGDLARTGNIAGSNINSSNVGSLELVKTMQVGGAILSVPAIHDGFIYVGTANGTEANSETDANGGSFHKIDLTSGDISASYFWETAGPDGDTHGFTGMGCTPAIVGDFVYFSAFDGKLYCLTADNLQEVWVIDLRNADLAHNQPVTHNANAAVQYGNDKPITGNGVEAVGWCSPLVVNDLIYVGFGEGENPVLYGFIYCIDAKTGDVVWIYCTSKFDKNQDNKVNQLPQSAVDTSTLPAQYSVFDDVTTPPVVRACVVWTALTYDADLDRVFCTTGNPQPDSILPADGYSYAIMSFAATTGDLVAWLQIPKESSYRPSDLDVDFGASAMIFDQPQSGGGTRKVVCAGCKNGGFFVLDADTMELLKWRQILPYANNGAQIPTVDPHGPDTGTNPNPRRTNAESNAWPAENFHGTYSTPAVDPGTGKIFIGSGGNNYHFIASGIDYETTPFMRAFDWQTLDDAWPMDDSDPKKYIKSSPPMYSFPGEAGLSSPAVVNDVVFCSTSKIAVYAFDVKDGTTLWSQDMGMQTGGFNGGYGYCLGPAVTGDYLVAGGLVLGRDGGVLMIFKLPNAAPPPVCGSNSGSGS